MEAKMNENVGKVYGGNLKSDNLKFAIVCSRFNDFFVSKLLDGAVDTLIRHGAAAKNIEVVWVPGSYELPFAVKKMAERRKYNAVIALGVVIQGATPHAGYINNEVSKALAQIGLDTGIPTIYGIITADNIEQAIERSGTKAGNKGADAAVAAIEMANLVKMLE
jgi:6,7-dimethyl-8-ribityllumazine synthase